jgi:uncharacterized protein (TIGR03435 family)
MRHRDGRFNSREKSRSPRRLLLAALLAALFSVVSTANAATQQPATASAVPTPAFDVAAIHLHESQPHEHNSITSYSTDGNFHAENVSVQTLVWWTYEMPESRIVGLPSWAGNTHFNIEATSDPSVDARLKNLAPQAASAEKRRMVQALLADRFKLVTHTETRELPVYQLVAAKGGPKLGPLQEKGTTINLWRDHVEVQTSNSVATLAEQLSKVTGRDVVDKTGISGRYHLTLKWTPDDSASTGGDSSESGPSLFTALEEQLGLKLESAKGPVEVLVIDHVEMPTAN